MILNAETSRQLLSYALIGIFANLLGYALYLLLTYFWEAPKLIMTALYSSGAIFSFFANRRITFRHDGCLGVAGIRYLFAQLLGYLLNLCFLVFFVDWLGYAHQSVQAAAILTVAVFLYILSKCYVFSPHVGEN